MSSPTLPGYERWSNRALVRLVWPLIIEQLLSVAIGIVDTVMVTAVSEAAVSGVSLVDSINILFVLLFSALATGGAVVSSQYLGRQQPDQASEAARQLTYSSTLLSFALMLVCLLLRSWLLRLIYGHIEPEVMQAAETYFWLSALTYPFIALYNSGAAIFRSMGNSQVSMVVALLVNILNIGGNSLFIFGFGWGVAGAALSTLISRAVAAAVLMFLLIRGKGIPIHLKGLLRFRLNFGMIRSILRIGIPNGLENSMFQIGKLLVARVISSFGTAAIAGNAIASSISMVSNLGGGAIGLALLTVVGQCVGAGDYEGAKKYTSKLMKVAHLAVFAVSLPIALFARQIIAPFGLSPEAAGIAWLLSVTYACTCIFFWPQSFALPNALRASGDARFTMVVSMFSMWVFRVGLAYLFSAVTDLGPLGVWLAMYADWLVRGGFFIARWKRGKWQSKRVIQE